jgi:hypothetical protein
MEVRRIAGALGAEISGLDLRSLEDDANPSFSYTNRPSFYSLQRI